MRKIVKMLIAGVFFTSFLFSSIGMGMKSALTNTNAKSVSSNTDKSANPLVLKHAKEIFSQKKDGSLKLAWHESHSSHVSHESHYSHYSGSSD